MRVLLIGLACALLIWAFWPVAKPLKPSAQLPTFEQSRADRQVLDAAWRAGALHEDPTRHELRQAVLNSANRLANSPCDKTLQLALRKATSAMAANTLRTRDDPVETYQYNGRVIDAGHYLSEAVATVINEANMDGVVRYDDILGKPVVPNAAPPRRDEPGYTGRYGCQNGT
ncbi:MAG TPA: hypothetical protein VKU84_14370 [Stellaceae bacterium]|nr:hypothetical protein [Stellaceae bacterium]